MVILSLATHEAWAQNGNPHPGTKRNDKIIVGRVERVYFPKYNFSLSARVDTGAHTSSLHVLNLKVVTQEGEEFVEFETEDRQGKKYPMKAKVEKVSKIKTNTGESGKRYVIREEVRLGSVSKEILINLNDRSEMKYGFLIGRNFLRGNFVVDVALSHALGD